MKTPKESREESLIISWKESLKETQDKFLTFQDACLLDAKPGLRLRYIQRAIFFGNVVLLPTALALEDSIKEFLKDLGRYP